MWQSLFLTQNQHPWPAICKTFVLEVYHCNRTLSRTCLVVSRHQYINIYQPSVRTWGVRIHAELGPINQETFLFDDISITSTLKLTLPATWAPVPSEMEPMCSISMDQCSNSPWCQCSLRRQQQQHAKDGWRSEIFAGNGECRPKLGAQKIHRKSWNRNQWIFEPLKHTQICIFWHPISKLQILVSNPGGPHETVCATCQHPRFKEAWPIDGARCFNCSFRAWEFQWPKSLDDHPRMT